MAKEFIGEHATADDVITMLSDKITDRQKRYNVYLNNKRKSSDTKSVAATKKVKVRDGRGVKVPVRQYSLDGKFISEFSSISAAAKAVGGSDKCISAAINGRSHSSKGYIWKRKYDDNQVNSCIIKTCTYPRKIGQYNLKGELVQEYNSIKQAADAVSTYYAKMRKALDQDCTLNGFMWKSIETQQTTSILQ